MIDFIYFINRILFSVLLWALLGNNPLSSGSRIPQAPCERGGRPAARRAVPLVLTLGQLVARKIGDRCSETDTRERLGSPLDRSHTIHYTGLRHQTDRKLSLALYCFSSSLHQERLERYIFNIEYEEEWKDVCEKLGGVFRVNESNRRMRPWKRFI